MGKRYPHKEKPIVVWDADGTLWDWTAMYAPAIGSLCDSLVQTTGLQAERIRASIKAVFDAHGTMDISHMVLLQELDIFGREGGVADQRKTIEAVLTAGAAFRATRKQTRRLFPEAKIILKTLQRARVRQIILSDAPAGKLADRVRRFTLAQYFEKVVGQNDPHYCDGDDRSTIVQLGAGQMKPNTDLLQVLGLKESDLDRIFVIGDNPEKDGELARNQRCRAILAQWGQPSDSQVAQLLQFASAQVVGRNASLTNTAQKLIMDMGNRLQIARQLSDVKYHLGLWPWPAKHPNSLLNRHGATK